MHMARPCDARTAGVLVAPEAFLRHDAHSSHSLQALTLVAPMRALGGLCSALNSMHSALVLSAVLSMPAHMASFRTDSQWLQCTQLVSGTPLRMRSSLWLLSWEWHRCMTAAQMHDSGIDEWQHSAPHLLSLCFTCTESAYIVPISTLWVQQHTLWEDPRSGCNMMGTGNDTHRTGLQEVAGDWRGQCTATGHVPATGATDDRFPVSANKAVHKCGLTTSGQIRKLSSIS
jgi:hypothetical protein